MGMVDKDSPLNEVFLHEKPVKILVALKNAGSKTYASTIAKVTDCTYSHTVKILDFLKQAGFVTFEKKGRIKYVKLTDLGDNVATDFDDLLKKFSKVGVSEEEVKRPKKK